MNALTAVRLGTLFEVAPPSHSGRHAAVVTILRRLLTGDISVLRDPELGEALVLAATVHRFAQCLLEDLGLAPDLGTPLHYREVGRLVQQQVPATAMAWTGLELQAVRPLPRVRAFLRAVSAPLVRDVLRWAPPVVLPAGRHESRLVVANHVPAILARQCLGGEAVGVGCVERSPMHPRALPAVCQGLVAVLAPVCACSWESVAAGVDQPADAVLLTGHSRAQVFRIRKAARAGGESLPGPRR